MAFDIGPAFFAYSNFFFRAVLVIPHQERSFDAMFHGLTASKANVRTEILHTPASRLFQFIRNPSVRGGTRQSTAEGEA